MMANEIDQLEMIIDENVQVTTTAAVAAAGEMLPIQLDDVATEVDSTQLSNALKVSRQFMILLEDYRYLLGCYQETCECHVNFDNQFFLRKLEEKSSILNKIADNNPLLMGALDDASDYATINQLWQEANLAGGAGPKADNQLYIKRIRVSERPVLQQSNTNNDNNNNRKQNGNDEANGSDYEGNDSTVGNQTANDSSTIQAPSIKTAYKCNRKKCEYLTFKQEEMAKHMMTHNGAHPGETGTGSAGGTVNIAGGKRQFDKNEVVYVCDHCSKEFSGAKWLENHVENVHAFVKVFACDYPNCSYKSRFRCVIDDHRKRHDATKEVKCTWPDCPSEFVTKRDMLAHLNFFHKGTKNYSCKFENCTAKFKDSNRLRHHQYTHSGERPYKCDFENCGAKFKQMPHLHKHRKTHQHQSQSNSSGAIRRFSTNDNDQFVEDPADPVCICPVKECAEQFASFDDFQKHLRDYHPDVSQVYKCETDGCPLYFINQDECTAHMTRDHSSGGSAANVLEALVDDS